jgi:hypothetical protein
MAISWGAVQRQPSKSCANREHAVFSHLAADIGNRGGHRAGKDFLSAARRAGLGAVCEGLRALYPEYAF